MSTAQVPPQNIDAEESVLGAMLVSEPTLTIVLSEVGLKAEDFYLDKHRTIFACINDLVTAGTAVDELTVTDTLTRRGEADAAGGRDHVALLAAKVPAAGNAKHYAEIVQQASTWRRRIAAAQNIQQAGHIYDDEAFEAAIAELGQRIGRESDFFDIERQRDVAYEQMEGKKKAEFFWPMEKLNRLMAGKKKRGTAGMRRGQLVILSGYTNEGKSHLAGQLLDTNRKHGRVCLYDNEMEPEEQIARRANRLAGIPYGDFLDGELDAEQAKKANRFINAKDLHWPLVRIKGWSIQEVCLHIRQYRWDFVVVDILHNFPFADERELSASVAHLKATAALADCTIVLVAHVNRGGVNNQTGQRRKPTRSDLRWSGDIENLADVVCFVYREQDDDGLASADGWVYFDKVRGGRLGAVSATFDENRGLWTANLQRVEPEPPSEPTELFAGKAA